MRVLMITCLSLIIFTIAGCAWLNKVAPSQTDESGSSIPGTHAVSQTTQDVAGMIPYGSVALNGFLLVWNFIEQAKAKKVGNGLKSTVLAIKQASEDPAIKEAIEKLKVYLANAHNVAGVQPLIRDLLAKV